MRCYYNDLFCKDLQNFNQEDGGRVPSATCPSKLAERSRKRIGIKVRQPPRNAFRFVDVRSRTVSPDIGSIFADWRPGDERVVVFSPHDDDGILGAGHALLAAQAFGGQAHVVIFCNGALGYSAPEQKDTIVETRRRETIAAYKAIGVPPENIHRLDIDDLSALAYIAWKLPGGYAGTVGRTIPLLRSLKATRLLIPNEYRENVDHEAVYKSGIYEGPQVGDAIIAEKGLADPIRSTLQYSVWCDFSPEAAMVEGRDTSLRANALVLCARSIAERLDDAILAWQSQAKIITGLIKAREARRFGGYMMEAYIQLDPRPVLAYRSYAKFLATLDVNL